MHSKNRCKYEEKNMKNQPYLLQTILHPHLIPPMTGEQEQMQRAFKLS